MAECMHFIGDDFVFPRRPNNRAALERIEYRIGSYPEFVELLMRQINSAVELRTWTHRAPDDPGIALLQGAAIISDILTFYQERYANEAFLRTARWRESIAALTRLLGYRLAPGVGGRASFALEFGGSSAVTVPAAFPLKTDLEEVDEPADFQTTEAITAYPHLSRFHFYRPRYYGTYLPTSVPRFELKSVDTSTAAAAVDRLDLKKGDRLMLVAGPPSWLAAGTNTNATQKRSQIVKVKSVKRQLGRTIVEIEANLRESWSLPVTAYRIGRTFRHFGHSAPPKYTVSSKNSSGKIDGAYEYSTAYFRHLDSTHECSNTSSSLDLSGDVIPLDQEVNDLVTGGRIIVQTRARKSGGALKHLTVVRTIAGTSATTLGFGSVTAPATMVELNAAISANTGMYLESDVRDFQLHEVTSPPLQLQPEAYFYTGNFSSGVNALLFYGTLAQVKVLPGRRLLLQMQQKPLVELRCTSQPGDFTLPAGVAVDEVLMWPISFDKSPQPLTRLDFDETNPAVVVFGNIVEADQGKREGDVAIGNGDGRARFQTFKLPKAPLTYHTSAGATPPQVPELDIYVNGRQWTRVPALFGRAADEEIYIVREDEEGNSYVQFGDGETGARLPSGIKNVMASYRSGSGAFGPAKAGSTPSAGQRLARLDKIQLPGIVAGGAPPESGDKARTAAPGRIQSLGRMVSLRDYETELLTIPGVTSATAAWALVDGVATLVLRVLLAAGREAEFNAIRDTIQAYGRCRGADRFAVKVEQAKLRYVYLDLLYAFDPRLVQSDVQARIGAALGLAGTEDASAPALFGLYRRRLGEREYARRIEGVIQNVPGVVWCKTAALGMFGAAQLDPEAIALPAAPRALTAQLTPTALQLLQLHPGHLTLTAAAPPSAGECA